MNSGEAAYLLAIMKSNWPGSYAKMTPADAKAAVVLWADLFADDPAELVQAAVKTIMLSEPEREFAPNVAAIKAKMYELTHPEQLGAQEAWQLVSKAVSGCDMQHPSKEFEKLPEMVQRAVGSANQLREWGMVDSGTFQTVVASNFRRVWEKENARAREQAALPADLRQMITGMARNMMLAEGDSGQNVEG